MAPRPPRASAVTFDAGQVLIAFEPLALVAKVSERGGRLEPARVEQAMGAAWELYSSEIPTRGPRGAWEAFMAHLVVEGGGEPSRELLTWLYEDNARRNLWRRPVPGVIELVRRLRAEGVPVGVVSNAEGGLEALLGELGWGDDFVCVADSARVGIEKPDPGIFAWTFARMGVSAEQVVHIGDSWTADVGGALAAGASAIWFPAIDDRTLPGPQVRAARDVAELSSALASLGVLRHPLGTSERA